MRKKENFVKFLNISIPTSSKTYLLKVQALYGSGRNFFFIWPDQAWQ